MIRHEFLPLFNIYVDIVDVHIVHSDDFRYSDMRKTYQGRIEERLPLLGIVMGENLQDTRPEATLLLHENSRVLTTAFDLHATILDVFGLKHLANNYTAPGSVMKRGISLFEHVRHFVLAKLCHHSYLVI